MHGLMQSLKKRTNRILPALLIILAANILLLGHYHNRTWVPHDDGYFAHVAERLLAGERLNADVQSRHGGYIHFVNAAAMAFFGRNLRSLRYPLVLLTAVQSFLIFFLFLPAGSVRLSAFTAVLITVFSFIQFLNPTANWYCLFLTVTAVWLFARGSPGRPSRIFSAGFLMGLIFLFRQLTGLFTGIGVLTYLLLEAPDGAKGTEVRLSRFCLAAMVFILCIYLARTSDLTGFLLFGVWPIVLLGWAFVHTQTSNQKTVRILEQAAAGLAAAFLPLAAYHFLNHSFSAWIDDMVFRSAGLMRLMPYRRWSSYLLYELAGAKQLMRHESLALMVNGFYWVWFPCLAFINGLLLAVYLFRTQTIDMKKIVLPFMAVFYALVSHLLRISIYSHYTAGLSLLGILWMSRLNCGRPSKGAKLWVALAVLLSVISIFYQAGQSTIRGFKGIVSGTRVPLVPVQGLPKVGLMINRPQLTLYRELITLIQKNTVPGEPIFVFPNNPEIYFLSGRPNPFRFHLAPMALQSKAEVTDFLDQFSRHPPALVIHHQGDKYNTVLTNTVVPFVKARYRLIAKIGKFDVYHFKSHTRP